MSIEPNLDDILSEIKERKKRENSFNSVSPTPSTSPTQQKRISEDFDFSTIQEPTTSPLSSAPKAEEIGDSPFQNPHTTTDKERITEQVAFQESNTNQSEERNYFDFDSPSDTPSPQDFSNTSSFPSQERPQATPTRRPVTRGSNQKKDLFGLEGHIRPITDKAKMRDRYIGLAQQEGGKSGEKAPRNNHWTKAFQPPAQTENIDEQGISSQGDLSDSLGATLHSGDSDTRRLPTPDFATMGATGREVNIEDIRRMDFQSASDGHFHYMEDDTPPEFEEGSLEEYREYRKGSNRVDIAQDIAKTKLSMFIRTALTSLLCLFIILFSLAAKFPAIPVIPALSPQAADIKNYLLTTVILSALLLVVNFDVVLRSLLGLFRMRANSATLASLAVIAVVVQGIVGFTKPEAIDPTLLNLYFPVAALSMLFVTLGRMSMIGRIQSNFKVVSSKLPKKAAVCCTNNQFCHDIAPDAMDRRPTVTYGVEGNFFTDFLALSFSDRYDVGLNRSVAPVCLLGAVVVGVVTRLLSNSNYAAVSAAAAVLCVGATFSSLFIENIPLSKLAKKLNPLGGVVSGNKAVEDFCDTHSLILTDKDLFPAKHITLRSIKAFSKGRLDEAILDAASVLGALDGSLGDVFLDMIGGKKHLLYHVDNITVEAGMGISAWIDKRRILIGNRMLMQTHNVLLPNDSYEKENPGAPVGNPIYLCNSGEVCARFLVNYDIDEPLAYQLDSLAAHNRRLVVYTSDPNINEQKIWELYGYPLELLSIMPGELHPEFQEMSIPQEDLPAEIVYTGKPATLIASIVSTISARSSILNASIVQLCQIALGYAFVTFMAFMGFIGNLSALHLIAYQGIWFVLIFLIQATRKN